VSASTIAEVFQPLSDHQTNQRPGNQPHTHNGRNVRRLRARRRGQQNQTNDHGQDAVDQVPAGTRRLQHTEVADHFKYATEQHRDGEHETQNSQRGGGVGEHVDCRSDQQQTGD